MSSSLGVEDLEHLSNNLECFDSLKVCLLAILDLPDVIADSLHLLSLLLDE